MEELKWSRAAARIQSEATEAGMVILDRSMPFSVIYQVGESGRPSFLTMEMFGQDVEDNLLKLKAVYLTALLTAGPEEVLVAEAELVNALTALVPQAAEFAARRRRRPRRIDTSLWPYPWELGAMAAVGAIIGSTLCVGWNVAAALIRWWF